MHPLERINIYSSPTPDDGAKIDVEAMMVDLVMVTKMSNHTKADLIARIAEMYDEVDVSVIHPSDN